MATLNRYEIMTTPVANFWLQPILDEIESRFPDGEIIVSSGISPSASYHIGHFREILSADIIKVGLELRGRQVKHLHVVDNFDPLRKRYDFLPESYEQYVGWPVCLVPDPYDCHESYAEHFFQEFYKWVPRLNIEATVINSYKDLYCSGRMSTQIEKTVAAVDQIKQVFAEVSNRQLADDWMPLQLLSDANSFTEWRYAGIDTAMQEIAWKDEAGKTGTIPYNNGRVKLNWRLDWPARWDALGVMVEPHGFQEHGASGGSYQTGVMFMDIIYGKPAPLPGFQYGHVHLAGDTIKMSSSKGNLITPDQAFKIMPPEMLRYWYTRFPGKKRIDFDPSIGLFRMMDEFSSIDRAVRSGEHPQFEDAYRIAVAGLDSPGMSSVPFNHLVSIYQAALGRTEEIFAILSRTGYEDEVTNQREALEHQLGYVKEWLANWAPEDVKFTLQATMPSVELSDSQKAMLQDLAAAIEVADASSSESDGMFYHTAIHEAREAHGLTPQEAFQTVYRVLLGKDSGPKAGWFLSILEPKMLIKRFRLEA